jgi:predicted ArsR family transcriptional regulator
MGSATKETILKTLRMQGKCSVKELAEAAEISPISVRHHLANLQADGLISAEEARKGVGRPYHLFSLTEKGLESFPRRYFRLTNHILKELKGSLPEDKVQEIFTGVASAMANAYTNEMEGLSLGERIEGLQTLLSEEGFEVEIESRNGELLIRELSCPYFGIGKSHPEVCVIDQTFIANALNVPVELFSCVLDGDTHCTFSVKLPQEEGA